MSSLKLKTPSGGSVSFNATDTANDVTLTVPASNATLLTTTNMPAPSELSTASGSAPSYSARAWVNFNGTGTVAIRASGNVSSITDNGTGDYTVNFTTAMPDANYAMAGSSLGYGSVSNDPGSFLLGSKSASSVTVKLLYFSASAFNSTPYDSSIVDVAIFR